MSRQTPTTSAPHHRSLLKPMLGSLAGSVLLLLSLLWTDPSSVSPPQIAATSASLQTDEPQTHLRPIEQVRLGERVHTDITPEQAAKAVDDPDSIPDWDRSDQPINRADWRQIELSVRKSDGHTLAVSLLRPATWLTDHEAVAGSRINLVMPEMGIDGPATVLSIGDCPAIAPGDGSVVTGTFAHRRGGVLRVRLAGIEDPLGVTDNHPLYSLDRADFVPAGELTVGERLAVSGGETTIESIDEQVAAEQVYNLEVQGEHVYRVALGGLLVHNSCVLLGEWMPRVRAAGAANGFRVWPARNWNAWRAAGVEVAKNKRWLRDQIKADNRIFSLAKNPGRSRGDYYREEVSLLLANGYRRRFSRTIEIPDFGNTKLYEWVIP